MTLQRQPSGDDDLIRFRCVCGKRLKAPRKHAGKPAKCSCGAMPLVPEDEGAKSADVAEAASEWYWRDPESRREIGPLPESAMRKLLASGAVTRSTMVRRADSEVWAAAEAWWEGFSEVRKPRKRGRDSTLVSEERDDLPLAVVRQPVPGAPVVRPTRRPAQKNLGSLPLSKVSKRIWWALGIGLALCVFDAFLHVWLRQRAHLGTLTRSDMIVGRVSTTLIYFVFPSIFALVVAKERNRR